MTASYSFKEGESAVENPDLIPSAELAYLGDSVIEVLVRERLVRFTVRVRLFFEITVRLVEQRPQPLMLSF